MEVVKFVIVLQTLGFCQAYQNSSSPTPKNASQVEVDAHQMAPLVTQPSGPCSWGLAPPKGAGGTAVILTAESRERLASQMCPALGCGEMYNLTESGAPVNSTCLAGCIYHNSHLRNCSEVVGSNCTILSEVICGHHAVRLVGGSHRCAGRVELWRAGQWGTVCDDRWDLADAGVVCAQLGCGHAVSVTGQGGPYGRGRDPILLDELNCTGTETSLWGCPAVRESHDCGHKEDAGAVCSEFKAVRLTGGLDRCSGKVEIHRNGTWGTVCDHCFAKEEATMVCSMLNCGRPKRFTAFKPTFSHNNGTLWYYICAKKHTDLWQCTELANHDFICKGSTAAGLICSDSRGLPPVTSTPNPTLLELSSPTTGSITTASIPSGAFGLPLSPELLGCIVLSFILLIALIANALLCRLNKKRDALFVQKRNADQQVTAERRENNYRESVNLVKVVNINDTDVPLNPSWPWTQSSVDRDDRDREQGDRDRALYEPGDLSTDPAFPLSTFRNSQRYSTENRMMASNLDRLCEEDAPGDANARSHGTHLSTHTATASVDSFGSSSTSSAECYENIGGHADDLHTEEQYENTGGDHVDDLHTEEQYENTGGGHADDLHTEEQYENTGGGHADDLHTEEQYENTEGDHVDDLHTEEQYENTGGGHADDLHTEEQYENTEGDHADDLHAEEQYENTWCFHDLDDVETPEDLCQPLSTHSADDFLKQTGYHDRDRSSLSIPSINHNQGVANGDISGKDSPLYSPVGHDLDQYSSDSDYDDIANYPQSPIQ